MKTKRHSTTIAEATIHLLIQTVHSIFMTCRATNDEIKSLKAKRETLDTNNPDFAESLHDRREAMNLYGRLTVLVLGIGIDFLLVYQGVSILCDRFGLPSFLRILLPICMIAVEIFIAYFQLIQRRSGESTGWIGRNTQYFVLVLLGGLSAAAIIFSAQTYDPALDHIGFMPYLTGVILFQLLLLLASILIHLWTINHAEAIAEAIAQLLYRIARNKLTNKIERMEKKNRNDHIPAFARNSQRLVQKINAFTADHPEAANEFSNAMPSDLQQAINMVMGKAVFALEPINKQP